MVYECDARTDVHNYGRVNSRRSFFVAIYNTILNRATITVLTAVDAA